jgi:hypothetical protein
MLDGLPVEGFGAVVVRQECTRSCLDAARPVRAAGTGPLLEPVEGVRGHLVLAAPDPRLDELGQRPAVEAEVVVLTGSPGGGEGLLVAADAVAQHRCRVIRQTDRASLPSR